MSPLGLRSGGPPTVIPPVVSGGHKGRPYD
jgi:hypothetical protein